MIPVMGVTGSVNRAQSIFGGFPPRARRFVLGMSAYACQEGYFVSSGLSRRDGQPLAIAGLWEAFRRPDGEIVRTYCIITVEATGAVAAIHDRMPLVLDEPDWPVWLGEVPGDPTALLRPAVGDTLVLKPMHGRTSPAPPAGRGTAARV